MRRFTLLISILCSFSVFSSTVEEAKALYSKRGLDKQGLENAQKAASIYKSLLTTAGMSEEEKANLLIGQAEALYFAGLVIQKNGDDKGALKVFWEGYEVGLAAVNLLGDGPGDKETPINPKVSGNEKILATAMYWELVNILRWGKIYGVFQALSKWKEIGRPRIEDILKLHPTAMDHGVHRSAGKALLTLPGNQKIDGKNALDFLEEAYQATSSGPVEGISLANNMATVTFYLEALRENKDTDKFCSIYEDLTNFMKKNINNDINLNSMFPKLVPEAKFEYEDFSKEKKNSKYYEKNC